jgi:hypothetical protein
MVSQVKVDAMQKKVDLLELVVENLLHALYEERSISREQAADLFYKLGVEMPKEKEWTKS